MGIDFGDFQPDPIIAEEWDQLGDPDYIPNADLAAPADANFNPDMALVPDDPVPDLHRIPPSFHPIYRQFYHLIRTGHRKTPLQDVYNVRVDMTRFDGDVLISILKKIHEITNEIYKLNFAIGSILSNKVTGDLSYFYVEKNSRYFAEPFLVTNQQDFSRLIEQLTDFDPNHYALLNR